MNYHEQDRPGWVRLPPAADDGWAGRPAAPSRAEGVRRVRRASNWTAAALIAGVAAATGYFAHYAPPATTTAGSTTQAPPAGQVPVAGHAAVASPHQASGSAPVVTSGGSGVVAGSVTGSAGTSAGGATTITWPDN
jgi:hypothetical protein